MVYYFICDLYLHCNDDAHLNDTVLYSFISRFAIKNKHLYTCMIK